MNTTLCWMPCRAVADSRKTLLVGRCLLGEVPEYLEGIVTLAHSVHSYNTRHALTGFALPKVNSNSGKKMLAYEGAVLFLACHKRSKCVETRDFYTRRNMHFRRCAVPSHYAF